MDDSSGLLRAIWDNPHDDTPRLVYADWLDDHATYSGQCGVCEGHGLLDEDGRGSSEGTICENCKGSWKGNGYADLAEFIRVQVELARIACFYCRSGSLCRHKGTRYSLRRRERELFGGAGDWWPDVPAGFVTLLPGGRYSAADYPIVEVACGFPATVYLTTDWLMGGQECENCGGTGRVDGHRYEQSEPCPDCGGEYGPSEEDNPRGVCPGTGRTPGLAAKLGAVVGLTAVRLVDLEPQLSEQHRGWWRWYTGSDADNGEIPEPVYHLLKGEYPTSKYGRSKQPYWPTRETARDALDAATLTYCRSEAAKTVTGVH